MLAPFRCYPPTIPLVAWPAPKCRIGGFLAFLSPVLWLPLDPGKPRMGECRGCTPTLRQLLCKQPHTVRVHTWKCFCFVCVDLLIVIDQSHDPSFIVDRHCSLSSDSGQSSAQRVSEQRCDACLWKQAWLTQAWRFQ